MITVFTSSYNHGKYLSESIESVLNQTYNNFEYLIYDDGSTDNSWDIIKDYASRDSRIKAFKLEKTPNVGYVINDSLKKTKGDYWVWCPGDDILSHNLLEECLLFSYQYPNSVLYNDWIVIDSNGKHLAQYSPSFSPEEFNKQVWISSPICFVGIWIPMTAFKKAGLFPLHLPYSEDFYWMIKATIDGVEFRHLPKTLHKRRTHNNSLTSRNINDIINNVPKIRNDLKKYMENNKK